MSPCAVATTFLIVIVLESNETELNSSSEYLLDKFAVCIPSVVIAGDNVVPEINFVSIPTPPEETPEVLKTRIISSLSYSSPSFGIFGTLKVRSKL